MYDRVIGLILGVGAVVFVLLLAGVGSAALTDDPPEVSPYVSGATTTAPSGGATFVISAVAFGDDGYVEITNVGDGAGSLDGHWVCQFPAYGGISGTLEPGETTRFAVESGGFGGLSEGSGEIGLYTASGFDDPDLIIAYVQWGEPGQARSGTAAQAGVWTAESVVDAAGAAMIIATEDVPTSADGWSAG